MKEKKCVREATQFLPNIGIKAKQAAGDLRQRYRKHKVSDFWPYLPLKQAENSSSPRKSTSLSIILKRYVFHNQLRVISFLLEA